MQQIVAQSELHTIPVYTGTHNMQCVPSGIVGFISKGTRTLYFISVMCKRFRTQALILCTTKQGRYEIPYYIQNNKIQSQQLKYRHADV